METARVKDFADFLSGAEVAAVIVLKGNEMIERGEVVLAVKDSVASAPGVPVPQEKFHQAMGIEATVISAGMSEGSKQNVTIKKA